MGKYIDLKNVEWLKFLNKRKPHYYFKLILVGITILLNVA